MVLRLPDSWSKWNLKMLVFEERGKPEYPEKNLSEQGKELTTNLTHIWLGSRELNLGRIGGRRVLSPLRHPCSPKCYDPLRPNREVPQPHIVRATLLLIINILICGMWVVFYTTRSMRKCRVPKGFRAPGLQDENFRALGIHMYITCFRVPGSTLVYNLDM